MGWTFHDAKIMQSQSFINRYQVTLHLRFVNFRFLVPYTNRVHMDHSAAMKGIPELMLDQVDLIMEGQNISCGRHFCMERDQYSARAVIMDNQIVNADNIRIFHNCLSDLLYKFRLRCLPQKGVNGFLYSPNACPKYQQANGQATIAIQGKTCKVGNQGASKYHSR